MSRLSHAITDAVYDASDEMCSALRRANVHRERLESALYELDLRANDLYVALNRLTQALDPVDRAIAPPSPEMSAEREPFPSPEPR